MTFDVVQFVRLSPRFPSSGQSIDGESRWKCSYLIWTVFVRTTHIGMQFEHPTHARPTENAPNNIIFIQIYYIVYFYVQRFLAVVCGFGFFACCTVINTASPAIKTYGYTYINFLLLCRIVFNRPLIILMLVADAPTRYNELHERETILARTVFPCMNQRYICLGLPFQHSRMGEIFPTSRHSDATHVNSIYSHRSVRCSWTVIL